MQHSIRSLLSNRGFVLLWCAYGISALGDHLSEMAILAHLGALKPDVDVTPLQARMTFSFMLPFFVFGAFSGALADRLPRKWVMIGADVMRVAIMFGFLGLIDTFTGIAGRQWGAYIPLGFVGIFATLFAPARSAMVPELVGSRDLVSANALIGGMGLIATMFAAVIGGELAQRGSIQTAFHADAATFALSALCLWFIRTPAKPADSQIGDAAGRHSRLGAGLRYVVTHRRVARLIGVAVVFWFSGATVRSVIPAIVKDVYGGDFRDIARFQAWLGLGLAGGAVLVTILGRALRSDVAITWCLAGIAAAIISLAGSVFVPAGATLAHVWGAASVFLAGVFGAGLTASYDALIQRMTPNRFRGRVYGVYHMSTVAGLLLATGALALPKWTALDRWAGFLLILIVFILLATAATTYRVRSFGFPFDRQFAFVRNLCELMVKFWYRLEPRTRCTIPRSGPVIVTANHLSPVDPLLVYGTCDYRRPAFMIAAEYYNAPIFGWFIRLARCIPVRRGENDVGATKTAIRRLRDGECIGMFIQGGIRNKETDEQLKNGVAMLALRTGATVIPAFISGVTDRDSTFKSVLSRHHARIAYGPPVDLSEFAAEGGRGNLDAATRGIFAAIKALEIKVTS